MERWPAARRRAWTALCWALHANAESRLILQEYTSKRLQRQAKTSPAADSVAKIPYYQPANWSRYWRPSLFYSTQLQIPLESITNTKFTDYRIQRQYTTGSLYISCLFPVSAGLCSHLDLSIPGASWLRKGSCWTGKQSWQTAGTAIPNQLTDHRGCHPKPSLKLVMENLETNVTKISEYLADTPPKKLYIKASGTPDRYPLIPV